MKNEFSRTVQVAGPGLGPAGYVFERFVDRGQESDASFGVSLAVPIVRRL